jgi:mRNA-degrading endonuclease toxin of MazEF toxin-antitoxin module
MARICRGDVFEWPNVPDDHPMGRKRRRWVVVSRESFNEDSRHILACPLTSYPPQPIDISIPKTPHNRLDHDSSLVVCMISPIKKATMGPVISHVGHKDLQPIIDRLDMIVGD